MLKYLKQILLILSATLFSSCGGDDFFIASDENAAISFSPKVDEATSTRAQTISTVTLKDFGVYASIDGPTPSLLMENERIYQDQSNQWRYDNIKYWPLDQTVSFFAYSPYGNGNVAFSYPDKKISCVIPADPDKQFDLMSAKALNKSANDGTVGLQFGHLLSRIDFAVSAGGNTNDINITLNNFEVVVSENSIYNSGVYDMTKGNWNIHDNSYMSGGNHQLIKTDTPLPDEGWDYSMILLPQEHAAGNITVNITYSISSDDINIDHRQIYVPLSRIVCEKGKKYTYNFIITLKNVSLEISVLPWNSDRWQTEVFPDNP